MDVTSQKAGAQLIIKATGRIDTETAVEYGDAIEDALYNINADIMELILDFSNIDYISSIGLRVILELKKKMVAPKNLKIVNVSESVMKVFKMTGFSNILTIEEA